MADQQGFGPDARRFLTELGEHNSREFFTANRERFDCEVGEPMAALIDTLPERYQPFRTFRMNRDVRFSTDKSPYKTQHAALHSAGGVHHYLHLDREGFLAACGNYQFGPAQLARYRAAVDRERTGERLAEILAVLRRKRTLEVGRGGPEPLKTTPRGYAADHPQIDLLRLKGLIVSRSVTGGDLGSQAALRRATLAVFEACTELADWLSGHVGDADDHEPGGDRGYRA